MIEGMVSNCVGVYCHFNFLYIVYVLNTCQIFMSCSPTFFSSFFTCLTSRQPAHHVPGCLRRRLHHDSCLADHKASRHVCVAGTPTLSAHVVRCYRQGSQPVTWLVTYAELGLLNIGDSTRVASDICTRTYPRSCRCITAAGPKSRRYIPSKAPSCRSPTSTWRRTDLATAGRQHAVPYACYKWPTFQRWTSRRQNSRPSAFLHNRERHMVEQMSPVYGCCPENPYCLLAHPSGLYRGAGWF